MVSFVIQKLLSLIRSHLFIFVFCFFITRGDGSKKILLKFMSKCVLPMYSSRSFIVYSFMFQSLIHFEFIFVYGFRESSNFILLCVAVQFSHHHLLKRISFLHCIFLPPCDKLVDHRSIGLALCYLCFPSIYSSAFVPAPHCFDDCSFVVYLKSGDLIPSGLFSFLKIAFTIQGLFCFHTHFKKILF